MKSVKSSTIYEVIIALLIFSIMASISFFTIFKIAENVDRKNGLKYENMIAEFKSSGTGYVIVEKTVYLYSDKFIWNKYVILSIDGDTLYVKNELQYVQNEN